MATFVWLTFGAEEHETLAVNMDLVRNFEESSTGGTILVMERSKALGVREDPETVYARWQTAVKDKEGREN